MRGQSGRPPDEEFRRIVDAAIELGVVGTDECSDAEFEAAIEKFRKILARYVESRRVSAAD
jgi:hypothetical protein